ncbi:UNVERIFIED_CONTAM: Acid beta-fructofuranosidase 2, vacuolar [Sesamum radiatum]|uniref:Acid beta-fructofuranosidase 2, vacuolar n=1 Tax=Sesamum radiatum TaxID=300843 RepID=A0AAW2MF08_SESRA
MATPSRCVGDGDAVAMVATASPSASGRRRRLENSSGRRVAQTGATMGAGVRRGSGRARAWAVGGGRPAIPRTILFDMKTGSNLLQWPVKEVERLRQNRTVFDNLEITPGSVVPLDVGSTSQLDIVAEFKVDEKALKQMNVNGSDTTYSCQKSGGAAERGALGPFGLLVLASKHLIEQTPIFFYISKDTKGNFKTFFCADHSRSSQANDVDKEIYGSTVPVLKDESLSMRIGEFESVKMDKLQQILVDRSIVESFAQGGRTCITSRAYPTRVACEDVKIFLFNNATDATITASLQIWQMSSASRQ